jgi:3-methyladenine DNA glycosylase AlkD
VAAPELKALLRPLLASYEPGDRASWTATVRELWDGAEYREERYAATAVARHRKARPWLDLGSVPLFRHLVVTGAWWDHVDAVATFMLGELLDGEPAALGPVMRAWATDRDMWKRRAAIVAQVRRKARTDVALLYDCIEPNRGDREFFIRKGIGWALRSYAWVDPDEIVRYCATHELSPLSRREALRNVVSDGRPGAARARPARRPSGAP